MFTTPVVTDANVSPTQGLNITFLSLIVASADQKRHAALANGQQALAARHAAIANYFKARLEGGHHAANN